MYQEIVEHVQDNLLQEFSAFYHSLELSRPFF